MFCETDNFVKPLEENQSHLSNKIPNDIVESSSVPSDTKFSPVNGDLNNDTKTFFFNNVC